MAMTEAIRIKVIMLKCMPTMFGKRGERMFSGNEIDRFWNAKTFRFLVIDDERESLTLDHFSPAR